jgi:alpha-tubulin suppressor-like RCC1 family protein
MDENVDNGQYLTKKVDLKHFGNQYIRQLVAGDYHSMFLTSMFAQAVTYTTVQNELYVCGYTGFGTIGHGSSNNATTPVRVFHQDWLLERVVGISAGQWHSCVTLANGRSYTWGYNSKGQLASGGGRNDVPNLASGVAMNFIVRVECGHASTVFLTSKKLEHTNKKTKIKYECLVMQIQKRLRTIWK